MVIPLIFFTELPGSQRLPHREFLEKWECLQKASSRSELCARNAGGKRLKLRFGLKFWSSWWYSCFLWRLQRCTEAGFTSKLFLWRFPWLKLLEIKVQHYNIDSHSKLMLQRFNQHDQFHNWGHTQRCFFISCFPFKLLMFVSLVNQRVIPVTPSSHLFAPWVTKSLPFIWHHRGRCRETRGRKQETKLRGSPDRLQLITLIWFDTSVPGLLRHTLEKNCGRENVNNYFTRVYF